MRNKKAATESRRRRKLRAAGTLCAVTVGAATMHVIGGTALAIPTTLTYYPSTDILGPSTFHFNTSLFSKSLKNTTFMSEGLSYGFGAQNDSFGGRSELGFDYISAGSALSTQASGLSVGKRLWFNGKTQLFNNDKSGTRIVAGFWGAGAKGDLNNTTFPPDAVYLLGSKAFTFGRIHLGLADMLQKKTFIGDANGKATRGNIQLGYDRTFDKGKLQFTLDAWTGKSAYGNISPGLLYNINDKSDVQVGYIHYNSPLLDINGNNVRNQIYVGFDYQFGGKAPAAATVNPAPPSTPTTGPASTPTKPGAQ